MKFLTLLIILHIYSFNCFSQLGIYQPINFNQTTYWNMSYRLYNGYPYIDGIAEQTFEVLNDTIINNLNYWKIHNYFTSFGSGNTSNCNPYFQSYNNSLLYLREDSIQRKVFRLSADTTQEIELVNFGLVQYDTLNLSGHKYLIDSVGIENINGTYRRVQYFKNTLSVEKTIEGIGSTINMPLSFYNEWAIPGFELMCFNNNGNTTYSNIYYTKQCTKNPQVYLSTTNHLIENIKLIKTDLKIILKNPLNKKLNFSLYSCDGKKLFNNLYSDYTNEIDLRNLTSGIYLIEITTNGRRLTDKIVIK